jgi:protein O-GlcNAc transferase
MMRQLSKESIQAMQTLLDQAIPLARAEQYGQALVLLVQVLKIDPMHAAAQNYLAEIYRLNGRFDDALLAINQLLTQQLNHAEYFNTRGAIYNQTSQFDLASVDFLKAIAINKRYAPAYSNLVNAYRALGKTKEALHVYEKAQKNDALSSDLLTNLGSLHFGNAEYDKARELTSAALKLTPGNLTALENYLIIHFAKPDQSTLETVKKYEFYKLSNIELTRKLFLFLYENKAVLEIERCVNYHLFENKDTQNLHFFAEGDGLNICFYLLAYYQKNGQYAQAKKIYLRLNELEPNNTAILNNYGSMEFGFKNYAFSLTLFDAVIQLSEKAYLAQRNAGACCLALGRTLEALAYYEQARQSNPLDQHTIVQILSIYLQIARWDQFESLKSKLAQAMVGESSDMIGSLQILSLSESIQEQSSYLKTVAKTLFTKKFLLNDSAARKTSTPKKIRIAYLSFDFRSHPVSYLTAELYGLHDRAQFEVYAYSYGPNDGSAYRKRVEAGVDYFVDLSEQSILESANRIYQDNIDILIDLTGNTQHTRSEMLAYKIAAVQVHWLGYIATMGHDCYDYIVSDAFTAPVDYDQYYAEKLLRLPYTLQVNDRQRVISDKPMCRTDFGLPESAFVFCNFGQIFKIQPKMFASWVSILKAVPNSVLWLAEQDPLAKDNLFKAFETHGVDTQRIVLSPRLPIPEYLARYRLADLMLDTYPVGSGTSASDCLWAGCPLLMLAGEIMYARMCGGILKAAHLEQMITYSFEEYEAKAIAFAQNPQALREITNQLRAERDRLPLFDTPQFVKYLEQGFVQMYSRAQQGLSAAPILITAQ